MLDVYDRAVILLVAIEGLSVEDASMRMTGATKKPGGKQLATVKRGLQRGLDAIADEIEPAIREIAA